LNCTHIICPAKPVCDELQEKSLELQKHSVFRKQMACAKVGTVPLLSMSAMMNLDTWHNKGRFHAYKGLKAFYRDEGHGYPILLIHGFPTASWDWHKVWPALASNYRLIAPDLLGFGYSAKPKRYDYSLPDQANLCESLLTELRIERAHVLAHDYGDSVAQELLARTNERTTPIQFRSFTFTNGGLFPETHRPVLLQKLLLSPLGPVIARLTTYAKFATNMRKIFGAQTQPSDEELDAFWSLLRRDDGLIVMPKLIRYMTERREQRQRWVGALQHATVPIALIDGMADPISGAHMVARFRELVPNAPVTELAAVGHYPQMEAPDALLHAFTNLLATL
jgi:pimeloyl-ACP methyl ester carboxylesterase